MKRLSSVLLRSLPWLATWILIGLSWLQMQFSISVLRAELYEIVVGNRFRAQTGFRHGSPYIKLGNQTQEVLTVNTAGALMDAGIKDGDIFVEPATATELYRQFELHRGNTMEIQVVTGGDGPPLRERQIKTITFHVPEDTVMKP